jgi:hypothetical protein
VGLREFGRHRGKIIFPDIHTAEVAADIGSAC